MKLHEEAYKGKTIAIYHDSSCENPREWENVTQMAFFHKRYIMGDKMDFNWNDFESWDEIREYIETHENVHTIFPVYMYEHSGIALKVGPFHCPFDSGQIGFIYITNETIKKEKLNIEKISEYFKIELNIYCQYLNGECYGFEINTEDGETLDSCYGYIGMDSVIEAAKECINQ